MIQVIKRGAAKPYFRTTCEKCRCEFSYQAEDLAGGWLGKLLGWRSVRCPQCNALITHLELTRVYDEPPPAPKA